MKERLRQECRGLESRGRWSYHSNNSFLCIFLVRKKRSSPAPFPQVTITMNTVSWFECKSALQASVFEHLIPRGDRPGWGLAGENGYWKWSLKIYMIAHILSSLCFPTTDTTQAISHCCPHVYPYPMIDCSPQLGYIFKSSHSL